MFMAATRKSNIKILLVEDSKAIPRENESALGRTGYAVICAEDDESALQLAKRHSPGLDFAGHDPDQDERARSIARFEERAGNRATQRPFRKEAVETACTRRGGLSRKGALLPARGINLLPKHLET